MKKLEEQEFTLYALDGTKRGSFMGIKEGEKIMTSDGHKIECAPAADVIFFTPKATVH